MTTETRGYAIAWVGVGLMLLAATLFVWKLF
jgi:hypothetical protein